jgi:hypothetical protein
VFDGGAAGVAPPRCREPVVSRGGRISAAAGGAGAYAVVVGETWCGRRAARRFFERIKLPLVGKDECGRPIHERMLVDGVLPELPLPKAAPVEMPTAMAVAA